MRVSDALRPEPLLREPVYYSGPQASRRLALTFDDGPSEYTADVLDVLAAHDARATFFVSGRAIENHADQVRRALAEGHELGNHLYDHLDSRSLSDEQISHEISRTSAVLSRAGCGVPKVVRPPFGSDAVRVGRLAKPLVYGPTILWTINPRDWCAPIEEIVQTVLDQAHPGGIVLMHDGRSRSETDELACTRTVSALKSILPELKSQGYSFVTVSEILI